ncbi:ankyrin repeat domain-containing protein [bacterium]|nr:ankyrin repeat domain-containing protein [bacterium]
MKSQLIAIIAAVVLVGCGPSESVLRSAASDGNIEAVKRQLAAGANVNAPNTYGWTALHKATDYGHKEIAELLIAKGADVNAKNKDEQTPLHRAAWSGLKEIAELLIAKGADVNALSVLFNGKTPLDAAIFNKQTETADLLRKHGGKTGEELKAEGK